MKDQAPPPPGQAQAQAKAREASRLEALHRLQVLDSPAEPAFDRITALAAHLFGVPVSLLSLVDEKRQWFKAKVGTALTEVPRSWGFCAHAILEERVFMVPDALSDDRFAQGALVRGDVNRPGLRFYAGAPLVVQGKHCIGTLCILDDVPRLPLTAAEEQTLRELSRVAVEMLELRAAENAARHRGPAERSSGEVQLLLTERLLAMGTLAAGVAHEINNPLAFVTSNLAFIAERLALLPQDPVLLELERAAREAHEGAERISQSVRDLRTLSKDDEALPKRPIDVRPLLDSCLQLAASEVAPRALVERDFRAVPEVFSSHARLAQIFLNLILNAAWSIPEGRAAENRIWISTSTDAEGRAVVVVRDTGQGLSPEQVRRLFEPFFSAAPMTARRGAGLGLAICHGIITALGGEISVESEVQKGSTFRVALPPGRPRPARGTASSEAQPAQEKPAGAGAEALARARARILVVDDEPMVGLAVERSLRSEHEVTLTRSAKEALALIVKGERYDLILCDVMMPEMSGIELEAAIRALDEPQSLRMVFLTGGAFTKRTQEFLARMQERVLEKPFGVSDLRAYVSGKVKPSGGGA